MAPYKYSELNAKHDEIRILKLLPGEFSDPLQGQILHVSLRIQEKKPSKLMPIDELQKTLPPDWEVAQTIEGRYVFGNWDVDVTLWTHPDPSFDPPCYEGYDDDVETLYEPKF